MKKSLLIIALLATVSTASTAYAVDVTKPASVSRKDAILATVKHKVKTVFATKAYVMPKQEIMPGDLERVAYGG